MQKTGLLLLIGLFAFGLILTGCSKTAKTPEGPPVLNVFLVKGVGYPPEAVETVIKDFKDKHKGLVVNVTFGDPGALQSSLQESAKADSATYDVVAVHETWITGLAQQKALKSLDKSLSKEQKQNLPPAVLSAFTSANRLLAMPYTLDFQMLYYMTSQVKSVGRGTPPFTLQEMEFQMNQIKSQKICQYPLVLPWGQNNDLVNNYALFSAMFGSDLFNSRYEPTFDQGGGANPGPAMNAFLKMALWKNQGFINPVSDEADAAKVRKEFMARGSTFTIGSLALQQEIDLLSSWTDRPYVARPPVDGSYQKQATNYTVTLTDCWGLAITARSARPQEAQALIEALTAPALAKAHPPLMPVWASLQSDQQFTSLDAYAQVKQETLAAARNLPRHPQYGKISEILAKNLHDSLMLKILPEQALKKAAQEIRALPKL